MEEDIHIAEQRLNKTSKIKQGMIQELLMGKTSYCLQDNQQSSENGDDTRVGERCT